MNVVNFIMAFSPRYFYKNESLRHDVEMDDVFSPFAPVKLKDMANGAGLVGMSTPFGLLVAIDPRIQVIWGKQFLREVEIRDAGKFPRMF